MSETRRQLFKTSILSVFGLMSASSIVKATGIKAEYIVARATKDGKNIDVLLQIRRGKMGVSLIQPSTNTTPPLPGKPFNISETILKKKDYKLVALSDGIISVGDAKLTIKGGFVTDDDSGQLTTPGWNEIGGTKIKCPDKSSQSE